jgi:hypothetical protein
MAGNGYGNFWGNQGGYGRSGGKEQMPSWMQTGTQQRSNRSNQMNQGGYQGPKYYNNQNAGYNYSGGMPKQLGGMSQGNRNQYNPYQQYQQFDQYENYTM